MGIEEKLLILAAAARYDASCSTSGSARKNSGEGIGSGAVGGICHSWSADGRCISLLKVLLSNACAWDCAYCANRRGADGPRATFEPDELAGLIMDFYKRNYIEGALLSSAVLGSPDRTMERLIEVAKLLRRREGYDGYLHLKAIPGASDELVRAAASYADRVSVNIEMPSAASLARVAPDKTAAAIFGPMRTLARATGFEPRRLLSDASRPELPSPSSRAPEPRPRFDGPPSTLDRSAAMSRRPSVREARRGRLRNPEAAILPAGQTTQLVIGASPESDAEILLLAENLYLAYDVRRVYYSAFIPVAIDPRVPAVSKPPLLREHRLYQADWLFRFYGFSAVEVFAGGSPSLDEDLDPKSSWALRNLARFPLDVQTASYAELLRVPGLGPVSASRILRARRSSRLGYAELARLGAVMRRAGPFLSFRGERGEDPFGSRPLDDPARLRALLADPGPRRLAASLFSGGQLEFAFADAD